jgi:hypothetical protein
MHYHPRTHVLVARSTLDSGQRRQHEKEANSESLRMKPMQAKTGGQIEGSPNYGPKSP